MSFNVAMLEAMQAEGLDLDACIRILRAGGPDTAAEKRRAWDRERKKEKRDAAKSGGMSGGNPPDPAPNEIDILTPTRENSEPNGSSQKSICFPADWQVPPPSELTPKARACAEQWGRESYETEAEGFALYWRQSKKRRPDWTGTWAAWVIRQHSKVMRDQKFGNAPPTTPRSVIPTDPAEALSWWVKQAAFYRSINREDDARRCDANAKAIEDENPELASKVASLVGRLTTELRVSKQRAAS